MKDYFYLEKMRFKERVRLVLELEFLDFFLPPLSLQPLVENAVRYGITQKDEGGTITVKSRMQDNQVLIIITDVTGYSQYALEALELHASGYLMKPVRADKLRKELDNLRHPLPPSNKRVQSNTYNLIATLMNVLRRAGIADLVLKTRCDIAINTEAVDCDYYRFLSGDASQSTRWSLFRRVFCCLMSLRIPHSIDLL